MNYNDINQKATHSSSVKRWGLWQWRWGELKMSKEPKELADGLDVVYEKKENLEWRLEFWPEQIGWKLYYLLR